MPRNESPLIGDVEQFTVMPPEVSALLAAATTVDGTPPISDGLLALVHDPTPQTRMWGLRDPGGALLGFGVAAPQGERGAAEAVLAPAHRGTGAGGALVRRMHADLTAAGAPAWFWSHGDHPAAGHLAAALGYARERELLQLHTDDSPVVPAPAAPDGVVLRDFAAGDEPGWLRVNNAAFDWHPEQGRQTPEDIAAIVGDPDFRPADVVIAERDGALIGFHQVKLHTDHPSGKTVGEVYVIAVDPHVHAKGVGRALTLEGMRRLLGLGAQVIELYVESDNVPARRLYESLGFTHAVVHASFAPPTE